MSEFPELLRVNLPALPYAEYAARAGVVSAISISNSGYRDYSDSIDRVIQFASQGWWVCYETGSSFCMVVSFSSGRACASAGMAAHQDKENWSKYLCHRARPT